VGATACEPTGCQLDCISGVSVNPGATTAKVTTTVGTKVTLHIFSDAAMTKLVGAMSSSTGATTHTVSTGQLGSATTYWWKVSATDANNVVRVETGSFKTFRREVALTIKRIHLIDDSDYLGDGEVDFDLKVNDDVFTDVYVNNDMPTGTDLTNLSITRTAANTPAGLTVKIQGSDDDCDAGLCTGGSYPSFTSGTNSDADWGHRHLRPDHPPGSRRHRQLVGQDHRLPHQVRGVRHLDGDLQGPLSRSTPGGAHRRSRTSGGGGDASGVGRGRADVRTERSGRGPVARQWRPRATREALQRVQVERGPDGEVDLVGTGIHVGADALDHLLVGPAEHAGSHELGDATELLAQAVVVPGQGPG
jgi:hypothetical protein